jgi:hypothetical protein
MKMLCVPALALARRAAYQPPPAPVLTLRLPPAVMRALEADAALCANVINARKPASAVRRIDTQTYESSSLGRCGKLQEQPYTQRAWLLRRCDRTIVSATARVLNRGPFRTRFMGLLVLDPSCDLASVSNPSAWDYFSIAPQDQAARGTGAHAVVEGLVTGRLR